MTSRKERLNDTLWLHSGQRFVAAFEVETVGVRIDAAEVLHRGVQVVHGYFVLDSVVAELIGRSVRDPRFDSAARHPETEAVRVVIATIGGLDCRQATELACPDDER